MDLCAKREVCKAPLLKLRERAVGAKHTWENVPARNPPEAASPCPAPCSAEQQRQRACARLRPRAANEAGERVLSEPGAAAVVRLEDRETAPGEEGERGEEASARGHVRAAVRELRGVQKRVRENMCKEQATAAAVRCCAAPLRCVSLWAPERIIGSIQSGELNP